MRMEGGWEGRWWGMAGKWGGLRENISFTWMCMFKHSSHQNRSAFYSDHTQPVNRKPVHQSNN